MGSDLYAHNTYFKKTDDDYLLSPRDCVLIEFTFYLHCSFKLK